MSRKIFDRRQGTPPSKQTEPFERCGKILLRKHALIETVNDELKNIAQIEHSRHRSFNNFIANSLSAIAACYFFEKKPAIDVDFSKDRQLTMF